MICSQKIRFLSKKKTAGRITMPRNELLRRARRQRDWTQRQLAEKVGVQEPTVRSWEAGIRSPSLEARRRLCDLFGASPDELGLSLSEISLSSTHPRYYWKIADPLEFFGREEEMRSLKHWILQERKRVFVILGGGGIGKTTLASKLAHDIAAHFDCIIWQSMEHGMPFETLLGECVQFICEGQDALVSPTSLDGLIWLFRTYRCLLVLDNFESLFVPGEPSFGNYRPGYEKYKALIESVSNA